MANKWFPLPRYIFRKKNILDFIGNINEEVSTYLDIGCGAGNLLNTIVKRYGGKGKGYDFSKEAINQANEMKNRKFSGIEDSVSFEVNKKEDLSDIQELYDVVICTEVLEHIENDRDFFSKLTALSKKYLIISVPAKKQLFTYSDKLAGHFRRYEREDVVELCEKENLSIVSLINYGYPFTDIIRLVRELFAKKALDTDIKNKKNRTKQSGIHIFSVMPFIRYIPMETILTPFYYFSKIFNNFDLSEGILIIAKKNES